MPFNSQMQVALGRFRHWGGTEKGQEDLIKAEQAFQKLWESRALH